MTVQTLTLKVYGSDFTWLLRHLWAEGNYYKALHMWTESFPQLSSRRVLKGKLIDILAGRAQLTGDSSAGMNIEPDSATYWDASRTGTPSDSFPLVSSWEDAIIIKKAKLYLAELALASFVQQRTYGRTPSECGNLSNVWANAAIENVTENELRKAVASLWQELRELSNALGISVTADSLPCGHVMLSTLRRSMQTESRVAGESNEENNKKRYHEVMAVLLPVKTYLIKKYKQDLVGIHPSEVAAMVGYDQSSWESPKVSFVDNVVLPAIKAGVDVDTYITDKIFEEKRDPENIKAEDVYSTKFDSGVIDREGNFYGCTYCNHNVFMDKLCTKLSIQTEDAEITLDELGFVRVSKNRFYWKESAGLTEAQKSCMLEYMAAKKLKKTSFNGCCEQTFDEAIG